MRAPSARQISNAAVATPPPMPQISTHSPSCTRGLRDEHPVRRLVDEWKRGRLLERERVVEEEDLPAATAISSQWVPSECSPSTEIVGPCSSPG